MFQVYATLDQRTSLARVAERARRAEALGYDGLNVPEAVHDGLLAAGLALAATTGLRVATSVLVAFARSPMAVALAAWDLQALSGGRFELGLGPQVRGNIVGRYAVPWSAPAPRMREYVQSLRAIFACFQGGGPLRFEGDHYRFTRLQPFFNPGPIERPEIPIRLGAIGPAMLALAGELADGLVTHPTNTGPRQLREVVAPALARGAARAGRPAEAVEWMLSPLVATGADAGEVARAREEQSRLLAFLYSTPAYWPALALFGWEDLGQHLHELSREGRWDEMPAAIPAELLEACVPAAPYGEIAAVLREWYGAFRGAIAFPMPDDPARDGLAARAIEELRA